MMLRKRVSLLRKARRGMVAAQVAVTLTALLGISALVLDGSRLYAERRHAQATADAAALAAASDLYYNWFNNSGSDPNGTAAASAQNTASANGYDNDTTTNSVTVNIPPKSGNFVGKAGYAEVILTWNQKRGLSAIFGSGTVPVSARAVAQGRSASGASGSPAILALTNTGTGITTKGNGVVDVTDPSGYTGKGGSIYVDSTSSNGVVTTGNASISAPNVFLAQSDAPSGGVTATGGGSITTSAPQLPDPLAYLPAPSSSNAPSGVNVVSLPNGISLTGQSSMTLNSNTIYILGGNGLSLSGQASITGTNVMIYVTGSKASISLTGQGSVNLTPMTTGPYAGIVMYQDRSDTNGDTLTGNGNLSIYGTIYSPAATITAVGNGTTDVFGSQVIANAVATKGNGTVHVAFDANTNYVPAIRDFGLVE